jgi:hypothetical protein
MREQAIAELAEAQDARQKQLEEEQKRLEEAMAHVRADLNAEPQARGVARTPKKAHEAARPPLHCCPLCLAKKAVPNKVAPRQNVHSIHSSKQLLRITRATQKA